MPHNRIAPRIFVATAMVAALLLAALAALLHDVPPAPAHASQSAAPPQNDNRASALPLVPMMMPEVDERSTAAATLEPGEPRPCGNIGKTVWYAGGASEQRTFTVDTSGSSFDTVVAVYRVDPAAPSDVSRLTEVACSDHPGTAGEVVSFGVSPGGMYAVQVGGHNGAGGTLRLRADCDPAGCPPPNDGLAHAQDLSAPWTLFGAFGTETHGATLEPGEPQPCGAIGKTTWYVVAGSGVRLRFDAQADFPVVTALYEGPPGATSFAQLTHVMCSTAVGPTAELVWDAQPGHVYYMQAGGDNDTGGNLTINGECALSCAPPANDAMANAGYLGADSADTNLVGTALEPGEPQPCGPISNSIWYFVPSLGQDVHVTATGSGGFQVVLAAYTIDPSKGPLPGSLQPAGCGGNFLDLGPVDPSMGYWLQVSGAGGVAGPVHIAVARGEASTAISTPTVIPNGYPPNGFPDGRVRPPNTGSGGYLPGARE